MSSSEASGSEAGSDFEPGAESEVSPIKPTPNEKASSSKRARNARSNGPNTSTTPNAPSAQSNANKATTPAAGSSNAGASTSQVPPHLQPPYLMSAIGPGGIPIMLPPGQAPMSNNERAHLYTFLRQLPLGFARADGSNGGAGTAALPFPFPMHPGLLQPANLSNDPIPSAHDAEAPPGESADSPTRSMTNSPSKPRPEPGTVEWARQRKDNHKEVERRRRGNINDGINELARIIPNGAGDKAKGAVLQRAVVYLRQMKESEQRTVEKWTMEKLMHDQTVAELQARLTEADQKFTGEKARREELEIEVSRLKKLLGETEEDELDEDDDEDERPTKRQRVA